MKNQFKFLIMFLLTGIFFGCQKSEVVKPEADIKETATEKASRLFGFNVEVKNDMLSFPTRDDYEGALEYLGPKDDNHFEEWESEIDFTSMRTSLGIIERERIGIVDNLLATLINKEGMIEIAGNIFKLDALNETVSVISSASFNESGLTGKGLSVFSTNDNILDILEGTDVKLSNVERARYCKKRKLSWDDRSLFDAKIVYQKAGFLNSLQSKLKNGKAGIFNLRIRTRGSNFWRNKKRSGTIPNYSSNFFDTGTKSYRPYYSSRRLKGYRFSIEFILQDKYYAGTSNNIFSRVLTIDCR